MSNELMVQGQSPLTVGEVVAQVQLIQQVMEKVMKKDIHYGVIPGCKKPSLWKPGAEKILSTFNIVADNPIIEDLSNEDEIRYRVTQRGLRMNDGMLVGSASGECSSEEEKYKWRKPVCPAEFDETPEDRRRTVWKSGGQNGAYQAKQVRTHPKDVANTILKMAIKRALVAMTLVVTAASDIFDQDLEDLPEGMAGEEQAPQRPPIQQPKAKEAPKEKTAAAPGPGDKPEPEGPYISEAQAKRFWAIAKASDRTDDQIHVWLKDKYGINSTAKIPRSMYDMICTNAATKEG